MALGEPLGGGDDVAVTAHLLQCGLCRGEVEALRHTVQLTREVVEHRDPPALPESVWEGIADEVGIAAAVPERRRGRHARDVPVPARRRWPRSLAAVAAAVAVGAAGTLGVLRPWRAGPVPAPSSVAALAPVAGGPAGASGRAVVVEGRSGPELRVSAAGLPLQPGFYEVWLYDGERGMVAVGVLAADSTAALPLPPTLDLRTYHVVDISQERYDGDQTHSADSVLRGTLTD